MSNSFVIKKGPSSRLFDKDGNCLIDLVENGWYLTTDTAEVYVALRAIPNDSSSALVLKKLNECDIDNDLDLSSFETRLQALEADHTHVYGYRQGFPTEGILNHIYVAEDEHRTYIFADGRYLHIADKFDSEDTDGDPSTPDVRIIHGGTAD